VTFPATLAAIILCLQLPIPLYWFVLHPLRRFWRRHPRAVWVVGLACSWLPVTTAIVAFHRTLLSDTWPSIGRLSAGLALTVFEAWIFWRVYRDLGTARLVGKAELEGGGTIETAGIYARVRHPRYVASFLAICGACLLAGTRLLSIVAAVWLALMTVAVVLEEREMRIRFGASFEEYCRRVPRFVPKG
jgi:protein-S-isoprenylcysteine O-methyltransferase Ste14